MGPPTKRSRHSSSMVHVYNVLVGFSQRDLSRATACVDVRLVWTVLLRVES